MTDRSEEVAADRLRLGARRRSAPVAPAPVEPAAPQQEVDDAAAAEPPARFEPPRDTPHRDPGPSRTIAATLVLTAVVAVVLGGLVTLYAATRPASYRSVSVLEIDQVNAIAGSGDEGVLAKLGRLRYKYAGIVTTDAFAAPVAQQAGLATPAVHGALFASVDPTSLLMSVGAISGSPGEAQRISQIAATQLVTYVGREQTTARIPSNQQVTFTVLSQASQGVRVAPNRKRALLVGALTALAVVVVGAVVADLLHRRRRS
jgi:capsular polysaccharide biosynthesis protein